MGTLSYRSRIHKNKLTWRSLRYVAADQMVRLFPPLRERWLFPTEAVPMAEAAVSAEAYPTCVIETAPPALIAHLVNRAVPLNATQKVYHFENAVALGQSGAMLQDGRLLAVRPSRTGRFRCARAATASSNCRRGGCIMRCCRRSRPSAMSSTGCSTMWCRS
jgi:hypothetical protein